jgi:hypothetical protein
MAEHFGLSFVLWVGITLFLLAWARNLSPSDAPTTSPIADFDPGQIQELEALGEWGVSPTKRSPALGVGAVISPEDRRF